MGGVSRQAIHDRTEDPRSDERGCRLKGVSDKLPLPCRQLVGEVPPRGIRMSAFCSNGPRFDEG